MRYRFTQPHTRRWLFVGIALLLISVSIAAWVSVLPQASRATTAEPVSGRSDLVQRGETGATEASTPTGLTAEQVIAAFNCARTRAALPEYARTAALDAEASRLLQQIQRDAQFHLHQGDGVYTLSGQFLLNADTPTRDCEVGGFDVANLPDLDKANTIGIAMRPLSNPYRQPLFQVAVVGR